MSGIQILKVFLFHKQAVAAALKLHTSEEREGIEKALFPAMLCAAAATGSVSRMEGNLNNGHGRL